VVSLTQDVQPAAQATGKSQRDDLMNFVFLMDPLASVDVHKDTSFLFMIGAVHRDHRVFHLPSGGLSYEEGMLWFEVTEVVPQVDPEAPFAIVQRMRMSQQKVDAVFIRTDPPFDGEYLMNTWLLDLLPKTIPVLNRPSGVRTVNEKLWAMQFEDLVPPTMVTRDRNRFKHFLDLHGEVVLKPTNGFGGAGVFRIRRDDTNASVIFETMSDHGSRELIIQGYLPAAEVGDKRIILLDGEPIGAVLRVHGEDDHRNNFFAGGRPEATEITENDRRIIAELKPHLQALGLHFVGIDVIGDHLIEVNVTSPTCLQEINRIDGKRHEIAVIERVEEMVLAGHHGKAQR
jgi:glutathione synthase